MTIQVRRKQTQYLVSRHPNSSLVRYINYSVHNDKLFLINISEINVYAGPRIHPRQKRSLENLAAYLIRSSFSQQRMEYLPDQAKVVYRSKDGKEKKTYDGLEWMAAMGSHVPERGQQSVRYYGAYADSTRGREQKREAVEEIPTVLEPDLCSREIPSERKFH